MEGGHFKAIPWAKRALWALNHHHLTSSLRPSSFCSLPVAGSCLLFEEPARARRKAGLSVPCLAFAWRGRVEVAGGHLLVWSQEALLCTSCGVQSSPPAHGESYFLTDE